MKSVICLLGVLGLVALCFAQQAWPCKGRVGEPATIFRTEDTFPAEEDQLSVLGIRSVTECAAKCYQNNTCRSAIYRDNGECVLFVKMSTDLSPTSSETGYQFISFGNLHQLESISPDLCPTPCSGSSVCVLDCTSGHPHQIAGCVEMDRTTFQSCGFNPPVNSMEYYLQGLNKDEYSEGYEYFRVTFNKERSDTALRVRFRGTLRGGHAWSNVGGWWKIQFNHADCVNPAPIRSYESNAANDVDHLKSTGIHGVCYGIEAGDVDISLVISVENSWMHVGKWSHGSRLFVDEMPLSDYASEPAVSSCSGLTAFNTRTLTHSTENTEDPPSTLLWSHSFTKIEADTALKINVDTTMTLAVIGTEESCATWFIKVDGNDCSPHPIGRMIANYDHNPEQVSMNHKGTEIEGYCTGISAGPHTVDLYVDICGFSNSRSSYDTTTGHKTDTRVIVEEIRMGTNVIAAIDDTNRYIYMVSDFNVHLYTAANPYSDVDDGLVLDLGDYFTKLYSESAIRVTMSAVTRSFFGNDPQVYSQCCRHYFLFNDVECENPGPIEGVNALNKDGNLHRPIYVEGTCSGISAGLVNVKINAGMCKGENKIGDCFFSWISYLHITFSETFVDRQVIDASGLA